jgi:signal transduction histidine kinase
MDILLRTMANVKKNGIICSDANSAKFIIGIEEVKNGFVDFMKRGIKIRHIIEITNDNVSYCKELAKYVELRHMDNVKGNFAISENEYVATARLQGATPLTQTIYSNVNAIIEQHRYFFENLWSNAIRADQRIREIEEGFEPEVFRLIEDVEEAKEIYISTASSIKKSAQLMLAESKSLERDNEIGIIDSLISAATVYNADIRIICPLPSDDNGKNILQRLHKEAPGIKIVYVTTTNPCTTLLIVDDSRFFGTELRRAGALQFAQATGYSIYSNSKPSVKSFSTFFDLLWISHELNEELLKTDQFQKEFINIAAHELRTPVQPILGMADLLELSLQPSAPSFQPISKTKTSNDLSIQIHNNDRRSMRNDAGYKIQEDGFSEMTNAETIQVARADIELIIRNARRLEKLTTYLLDAARIESNTFRLFKQPVDLDDVINKILAEKMALLAKKNKSGVKLEYNREYRFACHYAPHPSQEHQYLPSCLSSSSLSSKLNRGTDTTHNEGFIVPVDKERIIEVIYNILDNALKFTESGTISISLAKSSDGKEAVISVKDSGTGIDPLVLPKLFTKFTSSKSLLDKTGFGLGLYVSKAIIEAHGGKIRAENNEKYGGNGATFTFTLPITGHPIGN